MNCWKFSKLCHGTVPYRTTMTRSSEEQNEREITRSRLSSWGEDDLLTRDERWWLVLRGTWTIFFLPSFLWRKYCYHILCHVSNGMAQLVPGFKNKGGNGPRAGVLAHSGIRKKLSSASFNIDYLVFGFGRTRLGASRGEMRSSGAYTTDVKTLKKGWRVIRQYWCPLISLDIRFQKAPNITPKTKLSVRRSIEDAAFKPGFEIVKF